MNTFTNRPVVVGTDGSEPANAAVAYGAWEAERRGTALRLVHGYAVLMGYQGLGFAPNSGDLAYPLAAAQAVLADAADLARGGHPHLEVDTALITGSPAGTLVDESERAALVVVGSRGRGGFANLLLGSVSAQLAAHCRVPLVVVRPTGPGAPAVPTDRPVVVGVDGLPDSHAALAFGFDEAAARGVPLVAFYAWWMLPWTNLGMAESRFDPAEAEGEARRMLAEVVAGWAEKYPDVPVELRPTHHISPASALLDASRDAGLLVVSRHGGNALTRLVLGSFGDTLVRRALCPVAVVPESSGTNDG